MTPGGSVCFVWFTKRTPARAWEPSTKAAAGTPHFSNASFHIAHGSAPSPSRSSKYTRALERLTFHASPTSCSRARLRSSSCSFFA